MTIGSQMAESLTHCRCASEENGRMPANGTLYEHGGHRTQGFELSMQPPRREDDKSIDVTPECPGCPHLLFWMFASVGQEHLQVSVPSFPFERTDHGREVRICYVGHNHCDHAGPTSLHHPSRPIGDESKPRDGIFDTAPGFRRNLLRSAQCARDRRWMHTSFGRHVKDGGAPGLSHRTLRYSQRAQ
jgi:hypothetical protein